MRLTGILLILALQFFATIAGADGGIPAQDPELRLDDLFSQLQEAEAEDFVDIEREITGIWNHSGSASMDLLLERGQIAMAQQDYPKALEHLSALIDHAPEFAEGYNARATVYYLMDEYALSISDIKQTLTLNPRHFGALNGLGLIFEELGNPKGAYKAYTMARAVHPFLENVNEALIALQPLIDGVEL